MVITVPTTLEDDMARVAILGGNRIPFARSNGPYATASNQDMLTAALDGLVERTGIDPHLIEDVRWGCVQQQGEQGFDIARNAGAIRRRPATHHDHLRGERLLPALDEFLDAGSGVQAKDVIALVSGTPVLTVSNLEGFIAEGGMLELYAFGRNIVFGEVDGPDGTKIKASILFPNDPRRGHDARRVRHGGPRGRARRRTARAGGPRGRDRRCRGSAQRRQGALICL